MFNQLGMLADLMRNAGKLRESFEKAVESLGQLEVEGSAGGGAVTVKMNGRLEVVSVRIDPKLIADADNELLEDLVAAAVNAALVKAREGAAIVSFVDDRRIAVGALSRSGRRGRRSGRRGSLTMSGSGYAAAVDRLITALGRFPGIGAKSAERLAHHLLRCPAEEALELADAIRAAKERIKHCEVCFHLTEADEPLCAICSDPRRDQATVCVVEQSRDLMALEKAGAFHGVYHVLLGRLAPLSGMTAEQSDRRCPCRARPVRSRPRADHGHQSQPGRRRHRPPDRQPTGRIQREDHAACTRPGFRRHSRIRQSRHAQRRVHRPPAFLVAFSTPALVFPPVVA